LRASRRVTTVQHRRLPAVGYAVFGRYERKEGGFVLTDQLPLRAVGQEPRRRHRVRVEGVEAGHFIELGGCVYVRLLVAHVGQPGRNQARTRQPQRVQFDQLFGQGLA
jgi:hypothetical protein